MRASSVQMPFHAELPQPGLLTNSSTPWMLIRHYGCAKFSPSDQPNPDFVSRIQTSEKPCPLTLLWLQ
jgi:hypothetical protein